MRSTEQMNSEIIANLKKDLATARVLIERLAKPTVDLQAVRDGKEWLEKLNFFESARSSRTQK